jgi:hypothetical protein
MLAGFAEHCSLEGVLRSRTTSSVLSDEPGHVFDGGWLQARKKGHSRAGPEPGRSSGAHAIAAFPPAMGGKSEHRSDTLDRCYSTAVSL